MTRWDSAGHFASWLGLSPNNRGTVSRVISSKTKPSANRAAAALRLAANAAWLAVQIMAHNLACWTTRIGLGEPVATTKTLRRRFFSLAGRITRKARRLTLHLPQGWPWQNQFSRALAKLRGLPPPS